MVPYRSDAGQLAFDESRFLLCRVGQTEESYEYFVLPRSIAEATQGERSGLSRAAVYRWIVPQWFFQDYDGEPVDTAIVWVLADEYGRERYLREHDAPWRDSAELEERPHPTVGVGELHELESDWSVLVAPAERGCGRLPAPLGAGDEARVGLGGGGDRGEARRGHRDPVTSPTPTTARPGPASP